MSTLKQSVNIPLLRTPFHIECTEELTFEENMKAFEFFESDFKNRDKIFYINGKEVKADIDEEDMKYLVDEHEEEPN